jgi:hypothetical protein
MKIFIGITAATAAAFLFMGLQTGLFGPNRNRADDDAPEAQIVKEHKAPQKPRARFPEDLAPAARARAVPDAADFKAANKPHKVVILKVNGALHPWHERASNDHEDWAATNVEETELALIVSNHQKTVIETARFVNGPPVEREKWELEASIVEVKTGRVLANRRFINMPRAIQPREVWELTALGAPVHFETVWTWLSRQAKFGFTPTPNAEPIVTVEERQ